MNLPKMYCVTCCQTPWRTQGVLTRFKEAGVEVQLIEGIHGATAAIGPYLPHFDNPHHTISSGKVGLILSKLLAWTTMLERGGECILFEDDAVLCPDFKQELKKSIDALPSDWDVAHIGHCCIEDKPTTKINDRISRIKYPLCCHAVLWRPRALQIALETFKRISFTTHSDIILSKRVYPQLKHYSFTPPLVSQDLVDSEARQSGRWDSIQGWFDKYFRTIYDEALGRVYGPSVFVEIGCWKGRSTSYMGEQIKWRMLPVEFWAIDTWKGTIDHEGHQSEVDSIGGDMYPTFVHNISRAGVFNYIRPIQLPSVEASRRFSNKSVDFCMIDGDHSFNSVVADIQAWRPKMKPSGVITGHDVDRETVLKAVHQEFGQGNYRTWGTVWIVDPQV